MQLRVSACSLNCRRFLIAGRSLVTRPLHTWCPYVVPPCTVTRWPHSSCSGPFTADIGAFSSWIKSVVSRLHVTCAWRIPAAANAAGAQLHNSRDANVRASAALLLGALLQLLPQSAAETIARASEQLLGSLKDPDPKVRLQSVLALGCVKVAATTLDQC